MSISSRKPGLATCFLFFFTNIAYTSLADDEAALDGGAARGAGARMGTILRYRTGRKRLVALAIEIVEAHLARLTLVAKP